MSHAETPALPADSGAPATLAPVRPRPIDLDPALLRTFVMLAHTRSFTRTAVLVARSQSAVTQQIQKLEETLGQTLFVRARRRMGLTTSGEVLLAYAVRILDLLDELSAKLRAPGMRGEVRFGSPEDFATFFLPDILARFLGRHPALVLRTNCELTLNLIEGFAGGGYDAVVIKQEPGRLYPGAEPLWREQLVWVGAARTGPPSPPGIWPLPPRGLAPHAAPALAAAPVASTATVAAMPARPGADGAVRLVLSPAPCVYRKHALAALDAAGIAWTIVYTSPSLAGAAAAVKAGLGVTVLPQNMIPAGLARLADDQRLPRLKETEICLLARSGDNEAAGLFAAFIRESLAH